MLICSRVLTNIVEHSEFFKIQQRKHIIRMLLEVVMQQFGPNTKFGPKTDSDRRQIRPKILITAKITQNLQRF